MNKRILIVFLFLGVFSTQGFAWFNDIGNDSCLVIMSDRESYPITEFNREIEAELLISNNCGSSIADADIGLFVPSDLLNSVKFKSVHKFIPVQTKIVSHSYTCEHNFNYTLNPNYAKCFFNDVNGDYGIIWQGYFDSGNIQEKTVYWNSEEVIQLPEWKDVTQVFAQSVDLRNIELGLWGFDLKLGWKDVTIPQGNTRLKILFTVPFGYKGKGEFVIAGRSSSNHTFVSILDPFWFDTGYQYRRELSIYFSTDLNAGFPIDLNDFSFCTGTKCQPDKEDIRIVYAGNELSRHLEANPNGDINRIWFELPQKGITATTDQNAWVYYGNPSASYSDDSDFNLPATDFNSVMYRFEENAANTTVYDYGDKQFNATATTNTSNLHIQDGIFNSDFNCNLHNNDAIQYPKPNLKNGTIEMFVKLQAPPAASGRFLTGSHTAGDNKFYILANIQKYVDYPNCLNGEVTGYCVKYEFSSNNGVDSWDIAPSGWVWDLDTWTHIAVTWGDLGSNLYIDGRLISPSPGATGQLATPTYEPYICARNLIGSLNSPASMEVDSFKISSVQKTDFYRTYQYGENLVGNAIVSFGEEEYIGLPPSMSGIDLNVSYSQENGDILVTAYDVDDFEDSNVTLLCGTSPNPTVDTNNFCTGFSVPSPYYDVNCVGKGAAGNGVETVYCRVYDSVLYSIDQNTDTYIADNNAPVVLDWYLRNDLNNSDFMVDFWVELLDAGSGAKGAYYGLYKDGVLDVNGFSDVNADGFSVTSSSFIDLNGENSYIIWNSFLDNLNNRWEAVIKSGTHFFESPEKIWTFGTIDLNTNYDYDTDLMLMAFGKAELRVVTGGTTFTEFYGFDFPGNYTTSNTTIANSYCSLSEGMLSGYCDTNNYVPPFPIAAWVDVNITDYFDTTVANETHNAKSRSQTLLLVNVAGRSDFNAGGYGGIYSIGAYVYDDGADLGISPKLNVYGCSENYSTGDFILNSECKLLKIFDPTEVPNDVWSWVNFTVDGNVFEDWNTIKVIYDCPECTSIPNRRYELGLDNTSSGYSLKTLDGGTTWSSVSPASELMIDINHNTSGGIYQYSIDNGSTWEYIDVNGSLSPASPVPNQIIIRSNLKRFNATADTNVFDLTITYAESGYSTDYPSIIPHSPFIDINSDFSLIEFIELSVKEMGTEITYQITDDNGSTYYWHDGLDWVEAADSYLETNTGIEVNEKIFSFPISTGEIKFRAYFHTSCGCTPYLYNIDLNYILSPRLKGILQPVEGEYYNSQIDVNASVASTDVCDINLLDSSFVPVENLGFQLPVYSDICGTGLDTTGQEDGSYYLTVRTWNLEEGLYIDTNTANPFYIDNTPPSVLTIIPSTSTTAFSTDYNFFVELTDAGVGATDGNCSYGIYKNNVLDVNGIAQTYLGNVCRIGYSGYTVGDTFYLVTNTVKDSLGNSKLDIRKSGTLRVIFPPANPEDITNEDFLNVGLFGVYRSFAGIGLFLIPFFGLLAVFIVFFLFFKRGR